MTAGISLISGKPALIQHRYSCSPEFSKELGILIHTPTSRNKRRDIRSAHRPARERTPIRFQARHHRNRAGANPETPVRLAGSPAQIRRYVRRVASSAAPRHSSGTGAKFRRIEQLEQNSFSYVLSFISRAKLVEIDSPR